MQTERKKIIRYALDFNIQDVNTYSGYKGDLVLKITTKEKDAVLAIRKFALQEGVLEVAVKQNPHLQNFEIYCITKDENVYNVKLDEEKPKSKEHHEDIWSKTILN